NLLHGRVGGLAPLAAGDADQPELAHQPFDGAAGDVVPITPQPQPELARPVTAVLRLPGLGDDRLPVLVALFPLRGPAAAGVVVGRWGDPAVVLGEHPADRLDTPPQTAIGAVPVFVDERDYRVNGRSSSAAKKAEAAFKISFARRSSATSRLRRLISSCASLVTPGRAPVSTCIRRIHCRTVSGEPTPRSLAT